jgi:hypothetical protein
MGHKSNVSRSGESFLSGHLFLNCGALWALALGSPPDSKGYLVLAKALGLGLSVSTVSCGTLRSALLTVNQGQKPMPVCQNSLLQTWLSAQEGELGCISAILKGFL